MIDHTGCAHAGTPSARRVCRNLRNHKAALFGMITDALQATYIAATRENDVYDHADYERSWRVAEGLIMAYVEGDVADAAAIKDSWMDCNEFPGRYMSWTRDERVYNAGTWLDEEDRDAIAGRLGLLDDDVEEMIVDENDGPDPDAEYDRIVDAQLWNA